PGGPHQARRVRHLQDAARGDQHGLRAHGLGRGDPKRDRVLGGASGMVAILACAFPALLLLTIVALVPIRVPQPKPVAAGHPREPSRLSFAQSMGQRVVYLAVSFSLAVPITWAQFRLFELASLKSTDLDFAFRATDSLVVSILPSLPIGMLVSVP